jgi:hypothetical protein
MASCCCTSHIYSLFVISCLKRNLVFGKPERFYMLKSLLDHTTCFDRHLSFSGVSETTADGTAVFLFLCSIFGTGRGPCAHCQLNALVSYINALCMICFGVAYGIYVYMCTCPVVRIKELNTREQAT